jgi:allantoinase
MSPSGVEEFPHVTEADLREAMPVLRELDLPLLAHAESPARLLNPVGDPRLHETWRRSRPPEAEQAAIELLVNLAREYGTRVHIVHLASAEAVAVVKRARAEGLRITGETCPHYLTFAAEDVPDGATEFKCAPPIRERRQQEMLWEALGEGDIDLVVTDHSPAPPGTKCVETGDFIRAWGGIASLQFGLLATMTGAENNGLGIDAVSRWMSLAPSRLAGLAAIKGSIVPGADADLVIFDPHDSTWIDPKRLHHRHTLTPYAGRLLQGAVRTTMLRGEVVFRDGEVLPAPRGKVIASRS